MNVLRFVLLGLFGGIVNAGMGYDGRFFNGVAIGLLIAAVWRLSERVSRLERRAVAGENEEAQPAPAVIRAPVEEGSAPAATLRAPAPAAPDEDLFAIELPPELQARAGEPAKPVPREPPPFNGTQEVSVFEAKLRSLIFGGNPVVRAGLVVLFFGVAFLFKFAAEHQLVPVELRYLGVVAGAIVLLTIGWRQRSARPGFALLAQGGAVGVLYITVFAAMRLHDLVPAPLAFALLVALVTLSGLLAVLQDARGLAVAGAMGGFLAPILVSTGAGNHVALFSYYALLNAGVLGIAWYRSWRVLNLVGFVFTFGIGALWGFYSYRQDLFWSTEPFLILFFVMYVALSVLRATRRPPELRGYVDGTLVFGLPAIAFGLQAGLVRGMDFALAWSAFGMALIYLALALALWRRAGEGLRLLVEAFLALGVVFGSLAIPLAVEGRWTAAAWALEGAALVWIGVRQGRLGARVFGLLLQLGAGFFFLEGWRHSYLADLAVFNARFLGGACIATGGLLSAWHLRTKERLRESEGGLEPLLLGWGLLWWFGTIFHEAHDHLGYADRLHGYVALTALTAIAMSETARRTAWRTLALPLSATGFALLLLLFPDLGESHPFARFGFVAWGLALAALYGVLRRQENVLPRPALEWQHQTGLWMAALLLGAESSWALAQLSEGGDAWRLAAWGIAPLALMLLAIRLSARIAWPLAAWRNAYASLGPLPIVAVVAAGCAASALWADGDPAPLSYLPLINPLELSQLFVLLALLRWRMLKVAPAAIAGRFVDGAMGLVAFAVLNGVLARSVHFYAGVPFEWDPLLHSTELQTAFAVVWTLLALALTVTAARLGRRSLWLTGAALLVVVVAKLFLVDLVHSNTIERIISFLGVGALMLAIGFFAPLPPAAREKEA